MVRVFWRPRNKQQHRGQKQDFVAMGSFFSSLVVDLPLYMWRELEELYSAQWKVFRKDR